MGPSYKRLTPFLAIVMQGTLFNMGTILFGNNVVGQCIGAIFSSFWGFLQPLLIAYFVFGSHMLEGLQILQDFCKNYLPFFNLLMVFFACVAFKGGLSVLVVILARKMDEKRLMPLENAIFHLSEKTLNKPNKHRLLSPLIKDLCSLWFLLPLGLSMISIVVTEPYFTNVIITFLRMTGCYILFFMILSTINMKKLILIMQKKGFINLSKHFEYCLVFFKTLKGS